MMNIKQKIIMLLNIFNELDGNLTRHFYYYYFFLLKYNYNLYTFSTISNFDTR